MTLEMSRTAMPSTVVFADSENEQFFIAHTRTGMMFPPYAEELIRSIYSDVLRLDLLSQENPSPFGVRHAIKLRSVLVDDKYGSSMMRVDYLRDVGEDPRFTEEDIKLFLGNGEVRYLGQGQWVEVTIRTAHFASDNFSPVQDVYYQNNSDNLEFSEPV